ncbi:MAG: hypothetical protein R2867_10790 [Caldilineaceae bacterium]
MKEGASDAKAQLQSKAQSAFDEQKNRTADQAENVANALRQSSQEFRSNDQDSFAYYTDLAADQVESFSGYVRSKGLKDVLHDVQALARSQPELFMAGMLAGGFLLGRFFKSSQRSQSRNQRYGYGAGDQAYTDYYNENYRSPYPSGEYPQSYPRTQNQPQYDYDRGSTTGQRSPGFTGGATAFNGERSTQGQYRTTYGGDPAKTGADWGADYQANEFGQSTPVKETAARDKAAEDRDKTIEDRDKATESAQSKKEQ